MYRFQCRGQYALITSPDDLARKLFTPYIEHHRREYPFEELTPAELASRILADFLKENQSERTFNRRQRVILLASSFDPQTLSACAWLAKNGIDIRCIRLVPLCYSGEYFLQVEQLIPPPPLEQYFVPVADPSSPHRPTTANGRLLGKATLPRMPQLFEWGLVTPGDLVHIIGHDDQRAGLVDDRFVDAGSERLKYNDWGQKVTGWSAINIYEWTLHEPTGKTLDALRREKMEAIAEQSVDISPSTTDNQTSDHGPNPQ